MLAKIAKLLEALKLKKTVEKDHNDSIQPKTPKLEHLSVKKKRRQLLIIFAVGVLLFVGFLNFFVFDVPEPATKAQLQHTLDVKL